MILLTSTFAIILGSILLFYFLHRQWTSKFKYYSRLQSISFYENLQLIFASNDEQLKKLNKLTKKYGQYVKFWFGPDLNVCVKNPADVKYLLSSNKINQKGPVYRYMATYIGEGILTGGTSWRLHRKVVTPSYNKKSVQMYSSIFNKEGEELANILKNKDPNVTFDLFKYVLFTTTQTVCQTLLGLSKEDSICLKNVKEVMTETESIYDWTNCQMTQWWLHIPLLYWVSGGRKVGKIYLSKVKAMVLDVLKRRKSMKLNPNDQDEMTNAIDKWLSMRDMDNNLLLETFCIFTSSQEASAKITSAILLALAHQPEWQERIMNEIIEVIGPEEQLVTEEHLKKLQYLDMVFKEAIRYLPIAPMIQRRVTEEVCIKNESITLPVGTSIIIPIHAIHRDPDFWEHPDKFDPERFLPENINKRNLDAYLPFSLGAMDCLGRIFAISLVKTLVIKTLLKVQLEADGRIEDLKLKYAISVYFADGYNLRVRPRKKN